MDNGILVSSQGAEAARRFGHELRYRRTQAGLTQRQLAERVSYSREMVAAVERGRRYGSQQLAVRCDAVLRTDGVLTRMWPLVETEQVAADRRRGPRPGHPEPAGPVAAGVPAGRTASRGTAPHGAPANGSALHGAPINGTAPHGAPANGSAPRTVTSNGTALRGPTASATPLRGTPAGHAAPDGARGRGIASHLGTGRAIAGRPAAGHPAAGHAAAGNGPATGNGAVGQGVAGRGASAVVAGTTWAEWVHRLRPAIGDPSPEVMDQLRHLYRTLVLASEPGEH